MIVCTVILRKKDILSRSLPLASAQKVFMCMKIRTNQYYFLFCAFGLGLIHLANTRIIQSRLFEWQTRMLRLVERAFRFCHTHERDDRISTRRSLISAVALYWDDAERSELKMEHLISNWGCKLRIRQNIILKLIY